MPKRRLVFCVLFALLWVARGVPQGKSAGLSGDFSSAAMLLLRAVDSYEGMAETGVPDISDALSAASARAHTPGEIQTMKVLKTFLEDKLNNNALRDRTLTKAVNAWRAKHGQPDDDAALEAVKLEAMASPGIVEMARREDDCSNEVNRMLRSGTFHELQRCQDMRLSHDEHAMQHFFPQAAGS